MIYENVPAGINFEIKLSGKETVAAEDFGYLLAEVSRDYASTTGRTLILVGIERSSLIGEVADFAVASMPYLKDGVEIARGIAAVTSFTRAVRRVFERAEQGDVGRKKGKKKPGERTLQATLSAAVERGYQVKYQHQTPSGEVTSVEMTPPKAVEIRAKIEQRQLLLEAERTKLLGPSQRLLESPRMESLVASIKELSAPERRKDLDALLDVVVSALIESDQISTIRKIAEKLDEAGYPQLADQVIQAMKRNR